MAIRYKVVLEDRSSTFLCFYPPSLPTPEGLICPCSTCLVKGMCSGLNCDMLNEYDAVSKFIKEHDL